MVSRIRRAFGLRQFQVAHMMFQGREGFTRFFQNDRGF